MDTRAQELNQVEEGGKEAAVKELRSAIQAKKKEVKEGKNGRLYTWILEGFEELLQGTTEEICANVQVFSRL